PAGEVGVRRPGGGGPARRPLPLLTGPGVAASNGSPAPTSVQDPVPSNRTTRRRVYRRREVDQVTTSRWAHGGAGERCRTRVAPAGWRAPRAGPRRCRTSGAHA